MFFLTRFNMLVRLLLIFLKDVILWELVTIGFMDNSRYGLLCFDLVCGCLKGIAKEAKRADIVFFSYFLFSFNWQVIGKVYEIFSAALLFYSLCCDVPFQVEKIVH